MTPSAPSFRTAISLALICVTVILFTACSTNRPASPHPVSDTPAGQNSVIELLRVSTVRDKVRAIADRDGAVHVVIASSEQRQVVEVIVPRSGELQRRIIRSDVVPWRVDAAFDGQGRLHALLDTEHMVLDGNVWKPLDQTPWKSAGLNVKSARFVPGAPTLTWAFQVDGKDVGSPRRVEVYGFGGYGGGLIWPWVTHGMHTVLVSETQAGYGPWIVVAPQSKEDTSVFDMASDREGNVYLVYVQSRGGMAAAASNFFIRVDAKSFQGSASSEQGMPDKRATSTLHAVEGEKIRDQSVVRSQTSSGPVLISKPSGFYRDTTYLSSDTGGILHALTVGRAQDEWLGKRFPIRYQRFSGNSWSSPIDVGLADTSSFWGNIWSALDVASAGPNSAFAVWPVEQAILGRWIDQPP